MSEVQTSSRDEAFTEDAYISHLRTAASRFRSIGYAEVEPVLDAEAESPRCVLWRHDVDCSMQRALRLARLEAEAGIRATYFLYPRSLFYNLFSRAIIDVVREIATLGHEFGLHFDPGHYREALPPEKVDRLVARERDWIELDLGISLTSVSFHLYGVLKHPMPDHLRVGGLVNAYGARIQDGFEYVSDSNGLWRFKPLGEVLVANRTTHLQVLTHPVWWTPAPLPPRARVQRAIDGYALAIGEDFDRVVEASGRPNIR